MLKRLPTAPEAAPPATEDAIEAPRLGSPAGAAGLAAVMGTAKAGLAMRARRTTEVAACMMDEIVGVNEKIKEGVEVGSSSEVMKQRSDFQSAGL